MGTQKIQVTSIKDQIYQILKEEIINGKLKSGEKLVEQNIATRFNVSRSPVREAIKQLTGDGLVVNVTNHGVHVKVPTAKEMEDMQVVRSLFEEYAISQVSRGLTEQNRRKLEKLRESMLQTTDYKRYQALEQDLSIELVRMCDNRIIENDYIKIYTMMNNFSDLVMSMEQGSFEEAVQERVSLINALLDGNCELALTAVRKHSTQASQYIQKILYSDPVI